MGTDAIVGGCVVVLFVLVGVAVDALKVVALLLVVES